MTTLINDTLFNDPVTRSKAYFDGEWRSTPQTFEVFHPANGQSIGSVADCTPEDAKRAIDAAEIALKSWRKVNPYQRGLILRKWYELMLAHKEELARIMTLEMGKPITETRGEVHYAGSFIEWCAEEAGRISASEFLCVLTKSAA